MTSEPLTEGLFAGSILLVEDSPAKTYQSGNPKARESTARGVGFGKKCCEWPHNPFRNSFSLRMYVSCFIAGEIGYAPRWKTLVTKSGRSWWELEMPQRPICAAVHSWLPTPRTSQDWKPIRTMCPSEADSSHGVQLVAHLGTAHPELIGQYIHPEFLEWMQGFPTGWTELKPSETP